MMDDRGLDEFKGDVDFDFFDDEDSTSQVPSKDVVYGKPPAARKSPNPSTPTKLPDLSLDLSKKSTEKEYESESNSDDSYTSDSETESDSESDNENHSKNGGKNGKSALDKDNQRSRSNSYSEQSMTELESDIESLSNVSPVPTSKNTNRDNFSSDSHTSSDSDSDVDVESKSINVSSASRPKTAFKTKHEDAWTNGVNKSPASPKRPSDKETRKSRVSNKNSRQNPVSDSEGEITDVSPLTSAQNSPRRKKTNLRSRSDNYQNNGHANERGDNLSESERLDLNILVDAVSELDKDRRIKANTRRVMFAPVKTGDKLRENYSYSNERAKLIERENQRLLNEILHHVETRDKSVNRKSNYEPQIRRLTPSAINRERQQRKIEMENLALLRRLKKAKPTKGMSKLEHDEEYHRTMLYGVPISALHSTHSKSRASTPWDELSSSSRMGSRTRSLNSVHSAASTSTFGSSQFKRPLSAKKERRPEWNERW